LSDHHISELMAGACMVQTTNLVMEVIFFKSNNLVILCFPPGHMDAGDQHHLGGEGVGHEPGRSLLGKLLMPVEPPFCPFLLLAGPLSPSNLFRTATLLRDKHAAACNHAWICFVSTPAGRAGQLTTNLPKSSAAAS
jgi:hypothetical protein